MADAHTISEEQDFGIPELLENVLLFALDEAGDKMAKGQAVAPFTCLVVKDSLFIESYQGNTEECKDAARHTVQNARGASAYALCYDGFIYSDDGEVDALIAEGGIPGDDVGHAICCLYTVSGSDGDLTFADEAMYLGTTENFMVALPPCEENDDEELEEVCDEESVEEFGEELGEEYEEEAKEEPASEVDENRA